MRTFDTYINWFFHNCKFKAGFGKIKKGRRDFLRKMYGRRLYYENNKRAFFEELFVSQQYANKS